ncbi:P-loop containing nucleoside triphosphate hydrolase protein [Mycotypha africana]|uniref:P-loop containing nucleoside triphosphate hydrolase protein n=1 Tax=Mycotypha africana TaxID=64632 RepID=UPI0023012795|nr:P-loop containing nucleoside triphosphate hydrolase protein [Mycotypha africana]KAI8968860.1 P-loop containing nucleoside triphosphate hydrolase protein [Mycotypha africana]
MYSPQRNKLSSPNNTTSRHIAKTTTTSPLRNNRFKRTSATSLASAAASLKRPQADFESNQYGEEDNMTINKKRMRLSATSKRPASTLPNETSANLRLAGYRTTTPIAAVKEPSAMNQKPIYNTNATMTTPQLLEGHRSRQQLSMGNAPAQHKPCTTANTSWNNNYAMLSSIQPFDQKIRVCVRKRPLNKQEILSKELDVAPLVSARTLEIHAPKQKVDLTKYTEQHSFTFDDVFDSDASNRYIYERTTQPLVYHMFQGGKATCFAYGQTGSGKTYTMLHSNHGLYFQAIEDIFHLLNQPEYAHLQASAGYYEIYQGQLHDLLNKRKRLIPREDGKGNIIVSGLTEHRIRSSTTMKQVFDHGNKERTTCKTMTNENSSRSHAVLQILLKHQNGQVYGKLNFIDLAGSERGTDRGRNPDMKTRMEGAEINRSLLALKECIRALDQDKKHAPFRGSKLTMVLRDSFVGNSKTCMIATISPNHSNSDHTLNTLRYADRVKELRGESDPRLVENQAAILQNKRDSTTITTVPNSEQRMVYNHSPANYSMPNTRTSPMNNNTTTHRPSDSSSSLLPTTPPQRLTKDHIKAFIHEHKLQMEAVETYLRDSNTLIEDLEYTMEHLLPIGGDIVNQLLEERYRDYRNDLLHKGERVEHSLNNLKAKIEEDLADEDEYDDNT